jgi:hypothetical protein
LERYRGLIASFLVLASLRSQRRLLRFSKLASSKERVLKGETLGFPFKEKVWYDSPYFHEV